MQVPHVQALAPASRHAHGLPQTGIGPALGRDRTWTPGECRAVVLLVGDKELVGPPFTVVAGE